MIYIFSRKTFIFLSLEHFKWFFLDLDILNFSVYWYIVLCLKLSFSAEKQVFEKSYFTISRPKI